MVKHTHPLAWLTSGTALLTTCSETFFFCPCRHQEAHGRWKPGQDNAGESHRVPERGHDVSVVVSPSVINPQVQILHSKCKKCLNWNWMDGRRCWSSGDESIGLSGLACVCSSPSQQWRFWGGWSSAGRLSSRCTRASVHAWPGGFPLSRKPNLCAPQSHQRGQEEDRRPEADLWRGLWSGRLSGEWIP